MSVIWNSAKMADIFDLQMGKTPDRENVVYWNGTETWVAIGDMGESRYISSSKEMISTEAVSATGIKRVPMYTVIMSFKLSVGKVAITTTDLFTNEAIMAFKVKAGYDLIPEYIYYYLKGYKWQGGNRAVMGVTLNKTSISQGIFKYPDREEQQRIVAELDLLSGIIDKLKAELKELDNLAQSTFYDMFGDPIENPKGWEVKKIKEIAIVRPPKSEARNMLNDDEFVSFFPMEELGIKKMNAYSTKEKKLKDALAGSYSFFCDNDVLLAKVTPCFENGKSGIARQLKNGVGFGSSEIITFRCMSILIPEYLYSCFQCVSFLEKGEKCMTGTSGLRRLSKPFVEDTLLAVPPLALQQSFADKIASIEKQKAVLSQSIVETQKLLDYTMDKYFG